MPAAAPALPPTQTAPPVSGGNEATRAAEVVKRQLERLAARINAEQGSQVAEQPTAPTAPVAQTVPPANFDAVPVNQAADAPPADRAGKVAPGKYAAERPLLAEVVPQTPNGGIFVQQPEAPPAARAARVARGKNDVERPLIAEVAPDPRQTVGPPAAPPAAPGPANPPPAAAAARLAVGKARMEIPLVRAIAPARVPPEALEDEAIWTKIASFHADDAKLDDASLALIRSQNPTAAQAGRLARTKALAEDPVVRMVRAFQSSTALDTVMNEYRLHRKIHERLANIGNHAEVDAVNEWVYSQLFLTPSSDPWLGLAPADAYSALPAGGVAGK
jgi:hypothetical protein